MTNTIQLAVAGEMSEKEIQVSKFFSMTPKSGGDLSTLGDNAIYMTCNIGYGQSGEKYPLKKEKCFKVKTIGFIYKGLYPVTIKSGDTYLCHKINDRLYKAVI